MAEINYTKLEEILEGKKELAIFTHTHPDPDSIGSALGMQLLLEEQFGIKSDIYYPGRISNPENKSLVNLNNIELNLIESFDPKKYHGVILVDTARSELVPKPLVIVDHHKLEKNRVKAHLKYIRPVGACVTLVLKLLSHYKIELDKQKHEHIITAMAHGIRSDTGKFTLNVGTEDVLAYAALHESINYELLRKIENPLKTSAMTDALANAIKDREVKNSYLISGTGIVEESDAIPLAADYLLDMEGIETTIIYGVADNRIRCSIRTKNSNVNATELAQAIFSETLAGGKITSAGADVPLDFFNEPECEDELYSLVKKIIRKKVFRAIKIKEDED
ncbi:bifunctional oligoribonuclease/PAP phosphatase NrnA [Candidatus Woesearchaeota archaeon]|nr:bifunctional oligoribonuclease/PAP phosphatase NrnA [Candidatus Woesearchaeota archaeon]